MMTDPQWDDWRRKMLNEHARLYIKGANQRGKTRYLACDPLFTSEWTWTYRRDEANFFGLDRLPELLDRVRNKSGGYAVKLWTPDTTCTLSERNVVKE